MKKGKRVTAEELVAQLAADPEYQAGLERKRRRASEIVAAEQPILADLRAAGYPVDSLDEIVERYAPLPGALCSVLLSWLEKTRDPWIQEWIVRSLMHVAEGFDVRPLTGLFEMTESDSLRWAIANTLAELRPLDAREWLIEALARHEYGRSREMLPLAVARTAPPSVANKVLLSYFDEMPGHVALGLAESGGSDELDFLREKAPSTKGWVRKEIDRAVRKIAKRLRESQS